MGGVCAAEVRAGARAEVGVVAFGLVDPPPAQVLAEVNIERSHAAVLLVVAAERRRRMWKNEEKKNFRISGQNTYELCTFHCQWHHRNSQGRGGERER